MSQPSLQNQRKNADEQAGVKLEYSLLLDFYAALLVPRQREVLHYVYDEDLSLAEAGSMMKISRQGAHDLLRRGTRKLESLERKLGLAARYHRLQQCLDELEPFLVSCCKSGGDGCAQAKANLECLRNLFDGDAEKPDINRTYEN